ncbi:FixH family protein [Aquimarina sp. 2201CG5-10]|uniref:FixH family protein n=1 Tax=Aquimarina callyspongiae TaxID=3098150 RepID=UPI002AB3BC7C|nr:FixH family protein [Aquimarina sp. 2201CG5-10]MDY8134934.1 FixH family protein [Aquimarina sp. 2201CG5-10]
MKLNWGTSIVITFIAFISFIMYFVVKMNTDKKYEHDLVTEDYYKQELAFQNKINAEKNAKALATDISFIKTEEGLLVSFPEDKESVKISGTIHLYRPSNKQLDFKTPIILKKSQILISNQKLIEGRWKIIIDWKYNNTPYLFKKSFTY